MKKRCQPRWSYRQIAAVAEGPIRADMQDAKDHPGRAPHAARTAWGGRCGWRALVAGYEFPADHERLRALTGSSFEPAATEAQS